MSLLFHDRLLFIKFEINFNFFLIIIINNIPICCFLFGVYVFVCYNFFFSSFFFNFFFLFVEYDEEEKKT